MICILTNNLLKSQLNFEIITTLNKLKRTHNVGCFIRNLSAPFIRCDFPIFNCSKIFTSYINGICIATNLNDAEMLLNTFNLSKKVFYVHQLEFIRNNNFNRNVKIYSNIDLVTRSESYRQALLNYSNQNSKIGDLWKIATKAL